MNLQDDGAGDDRIVVGCMTIQQRWKILYERMLQDLTCFSKGQGSQPGTMIQYLKVLKITGMEDD